MKEVFTTENEGETRSFAKHFARRLKPGDSIFLRGNLGAGKTTFTKGLAKGLGIAEDVISPTFVIAREYVHAKLPLLHIDAYRLASAGVEGEALKQELDVAGLGDFGHGVTVVEWGESIAHFFAPRFEIDIKAPLVAGSEASFDTRLIEVVHFA